MISQDYLGKYNFLILTLDSCRWDSYLDASTPNLDNYCEPHMVYTPGYYTLPTHASMFRGIFPSNYNETSYYNRNDFSIFSLKHEMLPRIGVPCGIDFGYLNTTCLAEAFRLSNYHTVGLGGVRWFNPEFNTCAFLREGFEDFWYNYEEDKKDGPTCFERQIDALPELVDKNDKKKFVFLNSSITHWPFFHATLNLGMDVKDRMAQVKCIEKFDEDIPKLLSIIPKPLFVVIVGDHGECFGEDGLYIHPMYHPILMPVPMLVFEVL